ncbi:MAG: TRAP transporter substrate-binding protein DctP [Spirochaetota bacterium]|nr:TRAP transporter substrate-binding protein DctP [Spirochaetota bacterium]
MKGTKVCMITLTLSGLLIAGFSLSSVMAEKKPKYVWKWATLGQDTIKMVSILTVDFTQDVLKVTNGDVKCVWYLGGTMGDEEDYVAKMRIGQLHGSLISGTSNSSICPGISVMELPFLFDSYKEAGYVQKRMRPTIDKIAEKNGFKVLTTAHLDEHFYSSKFPLRSPDDFKKSKILTWHGSLEVEVLKALGASPIPVNVPEVVPSMRSGVVDGAISPSVWWLAAQLYTITKYINPLPIRYDQGLFVVVMKAWKKLPLNQRKAIEKLGNEVGKKLVKEMYKIGEDGKRAMINYGCKEIKMTPEEIALFKNRTKPVWDKMVGKAYSREMLNEVLSFRKQYRAQKR